MAITRIVTRDVINDLLPAYVAGEASGDTVALVDEFLRQDPDLVRTVEGLRANPLPELPIALPPTQEKETLLMTQRLLRWRANLLGLALFLTTVPLSFRFSDGQLTWMYFRDAPPAVTALTGLAALGCWGGYLYVRRRLRDTGL